jgi:hypothetical protein
MIAQRVYLDICALNRLFDDQQQMRVRLETDAVLLIMRFIQDGTLQLVYSRVHLIEIAANPTEETRLQVEQFVSRYGDRPSVNFDNVRRRTEQLMSGGFGPADAAHVAFAEALQADFVNVDDRLLRQCHRAGVSIWCGNPIAYCDKEKLGL